MNAASLLVINDGVVPVRDIDCDEVLALHQRLICAGVITFDHVNDMWWDHISAATLESFGVEILP